MSNTQLPAGNKRFNYFNKDYLFRSDGERECLYKTHQGAKVASFHKSVKRSADSDIEDTSNADVTNETVTTVNISAENMTMDIWNATTDNVTTEIVTTETDLRRIVYLHGLFEMSRGECRDFPETGLYEYKAALVAIQHINERNTIDGYKLQMYHNDTQVS
ncbi:hypothetical protein AVEN_183552-1 [Araneus ventricosus]|uniref:Uncharacterized protein n=1 Tax=Araneus ventricosus TaxID=182803 RepID=A0A4Y2FI45_ARAVE|nr:hypothetical protein AVEN_183552-1 [Araneus ventricosus]